MTVAFWQVITRGSADDPPLLLAVHQWAEGEMRLAAARNDAELVGRPSVTEVPLYWVGTGELDEDDLPVRRLEPATVLRVTGLPVPDRPDSVLVRWEQGTRRRVWGARPPAARIPRSGWGR